MPAYRRCVDCCALLDMALASPFYTSLICQQECVEPDYASKASKSGSKSSYNKEDNAEWSESSSPGWRRNLVVPGTEEYVLSGGKRMKLRNDVNRGE